MIRTSLSTFSRTVFSRTSTRSMSVVSLSDESAVKKFRLINNKSILYFTATWCPPCKAIKPVYEELSNTYTNVAFGKVDVDDNSDAALDFQVTSVPTFVLFHKEEVVGRFSGADKNQLEELVVGLNES
mmetsp:Transcript_15991/g.19525  ORF Transcript_15991/g.19525 Transcript_15991/m.19525 type:complete len:128 (-) Transcript_15991:1611-1994(-)